MMDLVLRNAAVRAAHEIAWMTDEIGELEAFAGGPTLAEADGSLHLDDVVERYRRASEAFSPRSRRRATTRRRRGRRPSWRTAEREQRSCAAGARSGADVARPRPHPRDPAMGPPEGRRRALPRDPRQRAACPALRKVAIPATYYCLLRSTTTTDS